MSRPIFMSVQPAKVNANWRADQKPFYINLTEENKYILDGAPTTLEQAKVIVERWCIANDRWVYELVGYEMKNQREFKFEEDLGYGY